MVCISRMQAMVQEAELKLCNKHVWKIVLLYYHGFSVFENCGYSTSLLVFKVFLNRFSSRTFFHNI